METMQKSFSKTVEELLVKVGKSEGLKDVQVKKMGEWEKGENYLGEVTPAKIIGKNGELDVIVKSASEKEGLRKSVRIDLLYQKEVFFYTQLLDTFRTFEQSKNIAMAIPYIPKCYATSLESNRETLILENLKVRNYELAERRKPLNHDHIQLVLETYGKWHAASFAFRQQNPQQFAKLYEGMKYNPTIDFHDQFDCANIYVNAWKSLKSTFDPKTEAKYIDFLNKCIEKIDILHDGMYDIDEKYSVIIHGDGWTNNFLFKYSKDQPIDLYLIDFQLSRIASPVLDLSHFLYSCAGRDCLHNLNKYWKIYHASLTHHLQKLGTNVEEVYPFNIFEKEWKKWSKWGFMISFILIKISLTEKTEAQNLQDAVGEDDVKKSFSYTIGNIQEYTSRCQDIVKHFVDNRFFEIS